MACLDFALPPAPSPPVPFSIPPLPTIPSPSEPRLCCQLPDIITMIAAQAPPLPLPPSTINSATVQTIVAAMQNAFATVQTFIDGLVPPCPKVSEIE